MRLPSTTGARFQISEIEYFGVPGNTIPFSIISIELNEAGDQATITAGGFEFGQPAAALS